MGTAQPAFRSSAYAELWGVVDGAVVDAFKNHPDYLTPKGQRNARTSVVKRVCGTVLSFAEQSARGRSYQPAETSVGDARLNSSASAFYDVGAGEGGLALSPPIHRVKLGKVTFKRKVSSRYLTEFNTTTNRLRAALATHGSPSKKEGE